MSDAAGCVRSGCVTGEPADEVATRVPGELADEVDDPRRGGADGASTAVARV